MIEDDLDIDDPSEDALGRQRRENVSERAALRSLRYKIRRADGSVAADRAARERDEADRAREAHALRFATVPAGDWVAAFEDLFR